MTTATIIIPDNAIRFESVSQWDQYAFNLGRREDDPIVPETAPQKYPCYAVLDDVRAGSGRQLRGRFQFYYVAEADAEALFIGKRVFYCCSNCGNEFTLSKKSIDKSEDMNLVFCSKKCWNEWDKSDDEAAIQNAHMGTVLIKIAERDLSF